MVGRLERVSCLSRGRTIAFSRRNSRSKFARTFVPFSDARAVYRRPARTKNTPAQAAAFGLKSVSKNARVSAAAAVTTWPVRYCFGRPFRFTAHERNQSRGVDWRFVSGSTGTLKVTRQSVGGGRTRSRSVHLRVSPLFGPATNVVRSGRNHQHRWLLRPFPSVGPHNFDIRPLVFEISNSRDRSPKSCTRVPLLSPDLRL